MPTSDPWGDVAPVASRTLDPAHRAILQTDSAVAPDVVDERGYHTLTREQVRALVDAKVVSKLALSGAGWFSIPMIRPDGQSHGETLRIVTPTGPAKYIWPSGKRNALIIHPSSIADICDPTVPIAFTEGIKKCDAILSAARAEGIRIAAVSVNGCWGWMSKTKEGSVPCPDFLDIPLEGRKCYVISDSDFKTNDNVMAGWNACATYLSSKTGEHRTFVVVVPPDGLAKQGADDYLASGKTLDSLLGLALTHKQALVDQSTEKKPLVIKTGIQVITEAGTAIPHLIHPLLPERGIVVMAGHSGTFKTWHALALMLDGAFGYSWLDHPDLTPRADPWHTLYVNKEMGGQVLASRLKALAQNPRVRDHPDFEKIVGARVFSTDEADLDLALPEQRERLEEAIVRQGIRLVILDSLSMCWSGNEDSNSEVGQFYGFLRQIIERTGVCFIIIHHLLKPNSGSQKIPAKFMVRGAGQIIQQADSAILLSPYNQESGDPDLREVSIEFMKTRTDREPPPFVSHFKTNEGLFISVEYAGRLTETAANAFSTTSDPNKLAIWMASTLSTMPAMEPGGAGLRSRQLTSILQASWNVEGQSPPAERTLLRRLDEMVQAGTLEKVEANRNLGDLFRFRAPTPGEEPAPLPGPPNLTVLPPKGSLLDTGDI